MGNNNFLFIQFHFFQSITSKRVKGILHFKKINELKISIISIF